MTKQHKGGFTLIEMLTVVAIIGILLVATLPAVTNLMKSSGLSIANRQVANTLGLARQLAITQRVYARVVFPYSTTASQPDMWYRTYAVITNRLNTPAAVADWRYASKWEYLPVGVVFLNLSPIGTAVLPAGAGALDDPQSLNRESGLPFPNLTLIPGPLAYIEFNPTGAAKALSAGGDSVLAITEGFVASGSVPTPTTAKTITNTLVNITSINVNSLVGHIQVTRP